MAGQFSRRCFGSSDHLGQIGSRKARPGKQAEFDQIHQTHRHEVASRPVGHCGGLKCGCDGQRPIRAHTQGVAIGRRLGGEVGSDCTNVARPIFNEDRLTQDPAHFPADRTGHEISGPARCIRNDELDGFVRIGLSRHVRHQQEEARKQSSGESMGTVFHIVSFEIPDQWFHHTVYVPFF